MNDKFWIDLSVLNNNISNHLTVCKKSIINCVQIESL